MSRALTTFTRIMGRCGWRALRWRPVVLFAAVLVAGGLAGVGPVVSQHEAVLRDTATAATEGAAPARGPAAAAAQSPRPVEVVTPPMERAYRHVFVAFGIAWMLIFAYVAILNRRVAAAERDLIRLQERDAAGETRGG